MGLGSGPTLPRPLGLDAHCATKLSTPLIGFGLFPIVYQGRSRFCINDHRARTSSAHRRLKQRAAGRAILGSKRPFPHRNGYPDLARKRGRSERSPMVFDVAAKN